MILTKNTDDEWVLDNSNGKYTNCYQCKQKMDLKKMDCFYICRKCDMVFCHKCQHNPDIKRMCPAEWTGSVTQPHVHLKGMGMIEKKDKPKIKQFLWLFSLLMLAIYPFW